MTATAAARILAGGCLLGTLVVAGGHTIYYLYYWEWVRAQIAATLTVAALVLGATWVILRRLDRLERAILDGRSALAPVPSEPVHRLEFPWLAAQFAPERHRTLLPIAVLAGGVPGVHEPASGVFIPVLLGAGLLASLAAGVIERTATAVHGPAGEKVRPVRTGPDEPGPRRHRSVARSQVLAAVVIAAVVIPGIWWSAHYDPEPWSEGRTEMTVEVASRSNVPVPAAEVLGVAARYCSLNAISGVSVERVRPGPAGSATVVLSPVLDEQAQRRFRGCLVDATLFRHRMTVTGTVERPAER